MDPAEDSPPRTLWWDLAFTARQTTEGFVSLDYLLRSRQARKTQAEGLLQLGLFTSQNL
jgi:hypothetical protein